MHDEMLPPDRELPALIEKISQALENGMLSSQVADLLRATRHKLISIEATRQLEAGIYSGYRRYQLAIDASGIGIWEWNLATGDLNIDARLKALLGYEENELSSTIADWTEHIHPEDREPVLHAAYQHMNGMTASLEVEHRMIHKSGSLRWMLLRAVALRDAKGQPYQIIGTIIDITERKYAEQQAIELAKERERVRVLAKFIEDASHDFRTPLTVINNNLYLLEMVSDPQQQKHLVSIIKKQVSNINKLLDSMLTMARLDTGVTLMLQPVDLNQLITDLCQQMRIIIEKKELTLRLDLGHKLPLLQVDLDKIQQAFTNILWNAIRYNRLGGTIIVRSWVRPGFVVTEISDTGIGISREDLQRIFERFYRVDEARPANQDTGGAGLGLPIAKMIVEAHGGFLDADSAEGVGSTFRVTLPAGESGSL